MKPFFFRRARQRADLAEEIETHIAMAARDRMARGEDEASAFQAARREFGNELLVREITQKQWSGVGLENAAREIVLVFRSLRRSPAFTVTAVIILALGIGMSSAVFAVVDAVLLKPLPVRDAERVVLLRSLDPAGIDVGMTQVEMRQVRTQSRSLRDVAGIAHQGAFATSLVDRERMLTLRAAWTTGNFFEVLGVRPMLGRFFNEREEVTMSSAPIVLSYGAWQREFGGDSTIIGRRLRNPYLRDAGGMIVGVAPPGLTYPSGAEYWTPVVYPILDVVARLATGHSPAAARAEFFSTITEIDKQRAASGTQGAHIVSSEVRTFSASVLGDVRPRLLGISAGVLLLLLIACLNTANLVLLRTAARENETAVRRSLGASSFDIIRPLIIESLMLALAGGAIGIGCARIMLETAMRNAPREMPNVEIVRISLSSIVLTIGIAAITLLLAALIPALVSSRRRLAAGLRADARSGRGGRGRNRLRTVIVGSQLALAMIMVCTAGLIVRSLANLTHIKLGYDPEHVSLLTLAKPFARDSADQQLRDMYDRVSPAIRALPDVVSISPVNTAPFYGPQVFVTRWAAAGQTEDAADVNSPLVPFESAGPDYFRTMDVPLLNGRTFTENDEKPGVRVVIVSHAIAERFWPGANAVGRQIRMVGDTSAAPYYTVIGEAGDIRYRTLRAPTPSVYVPWRQWYFGGVIAIRTRTPIATLLPALKNAVETADPETRIARTEQLKELVSEQLQLPRLSTLLLSGFGFAALLLAAIGLYGVTAAAVKERTHEFGIRSALGATPARLLRSVLATAALTSGAGAFVGITLALFGTRLVREQLFEVRPSDPVAILGAAGVFLILALLSAAIPAMRAMRADPASSLRAE